MPMTGQTGLDTYTIMGEARHENACLHITGIHTEFVQSAEIQHNVHRPIPDLR